MNILSAFGGGLWVIPLLTLISTAYFGYKGYKASRSGHTQQTRSGTVSGSENVPFNKTGWHWGFWLSLLVTIGIVIWMYNER